MPAFNLQDFKKTVKQDLKLIQQAADELQKISKKPVPDQQLFIALSTETRERARNTSQTIRRAFATVQDGTQDFAAVTEMSDEFKATLRRFQREAEAATVATRPLTTPRRPQGLTPDTGTGNLFTPVTNAHAVDVQFAERDDAGDDRQRVAELQASSLNYDILAEREEGIGNIHKTVNQVAEIFQDLALLVSEQGEHIDNIQTNIETANAQTIKGVKELAKANRSQKRARRRTCCIAFLCVLALVVLLLVLHATTPGF